MNWMIVFIFFDYSFPSTVIGINFMEENIFRDNNKQIHNRTSNHTYSRAEAGEA